MIPDSIRLACSKTNTFRAAHENIVLPSDYITWLLGYAKTNKFSQARICFHPSDESTFHHMLVYHHPDHIVPPHSHPTKSESIIVSVGSALLRVFTTDGNSVTSEHLLNHQTQSVYIPSGVVHSLEILEPLLFHEVTSGPFDPNSIIKLGPTHP